ncbi:MAG TPA: tRNA (adenosine(37)-N6)-threonylcarbamoyltransferase complex dimerization subunit type 1 TsaB, partial [Candidatus Sulfotelmatobacter sp.]|nr:tRNA (adenosine(37)-N6)-threonylcarbamoyltransferase complex dimerization subunit type 1 TsaB [Candidatus Sulfotelmatobacter sp.]
SGFPKHMLILAIDTSGQSGGITLAEAEKSAFRAIESAPIAGGTFSAQLIPALSALLSRHGFAAKDIGGFAAASGPGSFTGLRVGLSAIKGLAEVLNKPISVVSVLEALAALSKHQGKIAAVLDAGRSEIFLGLYERIGDGFPAMISEALLSQTALLEKLNDARPAVLIISDRSIADLFAAAAIPVQLVSRPGSEMVARMGAAKLFAQDTVSVEALDANYLRRSDAEIFFKGTR